MGIEIIQCPAPDEFDAAMLEIIHQGFSFPDEDESLAILDDHPDNTNEPDRVGEYPFRRCLHPAYAFSLRQLVDHMSDTIASWFFFISYVICPIFAVFFAMITR